MSGSRALVGLALLVAALSCGDLFGPDRSEKRLWINATAVVLRLGDTMRLGATMEIGGQIHQTPEIRASWPASLHLGWSSTQPTIASIGSAGLLHAEHIGRAEIELEVDGRRDSATVHVVSHEWAPPGRLASIATGGGHTCAVTPDGDAYCWGSSWFGQLGLGSPRQFTAVLAPVRVPVDDELVDVDASGRHSCALSVGGTIYCWGENRWGQLGDGSHTSRSRPVTVRSSTRFVSVSVGHDDTCALGEDGFVYCWGRALDAAAPRRVGTRTFSSVTVGGFHTCALDEEGRAYCWGSNVLGQLGDGTTEDSDAPVAVRGDHRFSMLSAGVDHTCGVRQDGVALCWGSGHGGRLGTGGATTSTPTPVAGEHTFASISAGLEHSCALTLAGQAYCWGASLYGQTGTGLTGEPGLTLPDLFIGSPAAVATELRFTGISASEAQHTCATTADGGAWCWGANTAGELGYGKQEFHPETHQYKRALPVRVAGPL